MTIPADDHWAAGSDDVEALDALLDAGADIEAPGAVLGGGAPLADARGFRQRAAARRLVQRGAATTSADEVDLAFRGACHGGRQSSAELLLAAGADVNRVPPWTDQTTLGRGFRGGRTGPRPPAARPRRPPATALDA